MHVLLINYVLLKRGDICGSMGAEGAIFKNLPPPPGKQKLSSNSPPPPPGKVFLDPRMRGSLEPPLPPLKETGRGAMTKDTCTVHELIQ